MNTPMSRLARIAALATAFAATAVALAAAPGTAAAPVRHLAATEYATEAFADPWDFGAGDDYHPGTPVHFKDVAFSEGVMSLTSTTRTPTLDQVPFLPGSLAWTRDGRKAPVDANRFKRFSIRMYSPVRSNAAFIWTACSWYDRSCQGATYFPVYAGWRTYDIAIAPSGTLTRAWTGKIIGVHVIPVSVANVRVSIDWMRLYQPQAGAPTARVDGVDVNASALPPGEYTTTGGDPLTVVAPPMPRILDPDEMGGADYAYSARRDAWDMSQTTDVRQFFNTTGVSFSNGVLRGVNGGANRQDNGFLLPMRGSFNGSTFHRLTVRSTYSGPFGLQNAAGGGMVARIHWNVASAGTTLQTSHDMVQYPGWRTMTYDLATNPPSIVTDEQQPARRIGWAGQGVTWLRWDHNEDPGSRTWYVDYITLRADDAGRGAFSITFEDQNWYAGERASIWLDDRNGGYQGRRIATVDVQKGVNTLAWRAPADLPNGTYWFFITVEGDNGKGRSYSTGPLRYTRP